VTNESGRNVWVGVAGSLLTALVLLASPVSMAAAPFAPRPLATPDALRDVQTQSIGEVSVSVSILTDAQAREHFGVDFARHELQALWMSVRNGSSRQLWFIRNVLDPDFYSAEEAALLTQGEIRSADRPKLHQLLRDESIRARLVPRTITEGFVFLPRVEGGRFVDVRLLGDAYVDGDADGGKPNSAAAGAASSTSGGMPWELRFEFALPLPDGDFDYERLDPARTYAGRALPDLTLEQLRTTLEQLPCCAADAAGRAEGDPLNIVLVGEADEVLHSLTRAGWSFTHRINLRTVRREIGAAVSGSAYPIAPVSSLHLFDRRQDVALQRARRSIAQRNHMRLWLAPFRHEGRSVWVGQVSRDIGVKVTPKSPTLTTHVIDPEVDTTREYLFHSLLAQGFVAHFGFVKGSGAATPEAPRRNLTDDPYHSDGLRLVVLLAPEPVRPDQVRSLRWEQSAPPIAEGQSPAALDHVRPIDSPASSTR
jgi:hypothetical protein